MYNSKEMIKYKAQAFHPFLNRNGIIKKAHHTINVLKIEVTIISFEYGNHSAKTIWSNALIM